MTESAFSRELMTMLVFPKDLNKKCQVLEKRQHFIFSIIYKGFILMFQKMTQVVLTKSQLLRIKGTYGPKM